LNMSKTAASQDLVKWRGIIKKRNLLLPLLIINGDLRISGPFDMRQLMDIIEVETEIEGISS